MAADPVADHAAHTPPSLVRRALLRAFGPPPIDPDADPGDPGLTGPGSASWKVIGEPSAIVGGVRGLLVQLAHPLAMAGVHDHSAFRTDPLGRLQRTSAWVTTTTFGSTREAFAVSRRVRAAHRRVTGTAPDGRPYTAEDPGLLAWVSIALTSSFLAAHRQWAVDPIPDEDAFVAEQSRISALLDPRVDLEALARDPAAAAAIRAGDVALPLVDDGLLPLTAAGLDARLADYVSDLGINHQAREAIAFLRRPPLTGGSRLAYPLLFVGALASLDDDVAAALEVRWPDSARRAGLAVTAVALEAVRRGAGTSPTQVAAASRCAAVH